MRQHYSYRDKRKCTAFTAILPKNMLKCTVLCHQTTNPGHKFMPSCVHASGELGKELVQ